MFKPVNVKRTQAFENRTKKNRINRFIIDEETNDQPAPDVVGNQKFLYLKVNKGTMKVIKTAMQIQLDKVSNPALYDPIRDAEDIAEVKEAAEEVRRAYDIISEGA